MRSIAVKVKEMGRPNWHAGTALFRLSPPIEVNDCGFLTETEFVIVAFTPRAVDHLDKETNIFYAHGNGRTYHDWDLDAVEVSDCRVVGKNDHAAALRKIGYEIVEDKRDVVEGIREFRAKIRAIRGRP